MVYGFGPEGADVSDCYAACWDTDFPVVRWNLLTGEQTIQPTPKRLHGSSAISVSGDEAMFYGPYAPAEQPLPGVLAFG